MSYAKNTVSTVIPGLRYRDANVAIEWLVQAFGFEKQLVVPGENGTVIHAQLRFGNGMVMLGTVREDEGPHPTNQSVICLIAEDADAVYATAVAAGANIVYPLQDQEYGGRSFSCTDPEGNHWNIGTYDPWEE